MRKKCSSKINYFVGLIVLMICSIACNPKQLHQKGKVGGYFEPAPIVSVDSVWISNNQLIMTGSQVDKIETIRITGANSFDENFDIESATYYMVVANGQRDLIFTVDQEYSIEVSDPYAKISLPVKFVIKDKSITAVMLDKMNANMGDVLSWNFNLGRWGSISLNGFKCQGEWDARTDIPDNYPLAGDYYYVSHNGNSYLDGISSWNEGDWAIYNGNNWERVENPPLIPIVYGRSGAVEAEKGDYTFKQIDRSDAFLIDFPDFTVESTPALMDVIAWSEEDQEFRPKGVAILPESVTGESIFENAIESRSIIDNTIVNADIHPDAEIDYSKLNIGDNNLSVSQTSGLQAALDGRLSLSGGTMLGNLDLSGNNLLNVNTINGFLISDLEASISINYSDLLVLDTSMVVENTTLGGLYYTEARAQASIVQNALNDGVLDLAPSQDIVYDQLALKEENIDETVDATLNSISTTAEDGLVLSCVVGCTDTGEIRLKELATNGAEYVVINAPDSIANNTVWTLPPVDATFGKFVVTNGNKGLEWFDLDTSGGLVTDLTTVSPVNTDAGQSRTLTCDQSNSLQDGYLSQADWITFNSKQDAYDSLTDIGGLTIADDNFIVSNGTTWVTEASPAVKIAFNLDNVENTALSTWPGTTNLTTLGTIDTGVWNGAIIGIAYLPDGGDWNLASDLNFDSNTLVITNAGNVGIGTNSPSANLEVNGTMQIDNIELMLQQDTSRETTAALRLQATGTNADAILSVMPSGTSTTSRIGLYNDSDTGSTGRLNYSVDNDVFRIESEEFGGTAITKFALTAGLTGIGTTTPNEALTIEGALALAENNSSSGLNGNYGKLYVKGDTKLYYQNDGGSEFCVSCLTPDDFGNHTSTKDIDLSTFKIVGNGGSNGISIDENGNVGISDATPDASLDIKDVLFLGKSSDVAVASDILFDGDGLIAAEENFYLNIGSTGISGDLFIGEGTENSGTVNLVTVKNSGNVGIGTSTPAEKLVVNGALSLLEDSTPALSTTNYGKIFTIPDDSHLYFMNSIGEVTDLNLNEQDNLGNHTCEQNLDLDTYKLVGNGGASGIEINPSGNVGIGTSAPSDDLHISGDLRIEDGINASKIYGYGGLKFSRSGSGSGTIVNFNAVSTELDPNYVKVANATPGFAVALTVDGTEADIDFKIDGKGTGSVLFNGNVGIGASPNDKLTIEGIMSLLAVTEPASTGDYGKLYTDGIDLFFKDDDDVVTNLTRSEAGAVYDEQDAGEDSGLNDAGCTVALLNRSSVGAEVMGVEASPNNQFTLDRGRYFIEWRAPGLKAADHYTYLEDVANNLVKVGSSVAGGEKENANDSFGFALLTVDVTTSYQIQHCAEEKDGKAFMEGHNEDTLDGNTDSKNMFVQVVIEKI